MEQSFGNPDEMYLSKPVMMSPSTSVTTRNEMVHGVIVRQINLQLYTQRMEGDGAAGTRSGWDAWGRKALVRNEGFAPRGECLLLFGQGCCRSAGLGFQPTMTPD
jgi:hypothetical protein